MTSRFDLPPMGQPPGSRGHGPVIEPVSPSEGPLSQWIRTLKAERRLIAWVALPLAAWTTIYAVAVYQPQYRSSAKVLIRDSAVTSRYVVPEQYYSMQTTSSSASNPVLNMMGLLRSDTISQALWQHFRKREPAELRKKNIRTFRDWQMFYGEGVHLLKGKNVPGTDLIGLELTWSHPRVAQDALAVALQAFQDSSQDLNRREHKTRSEYLDGQVAEITRELQTVRNRKSAYKRRLATVNLARESDDLAHTRTELQTQLNATLAKAAGRSAELNRYRQSLGLSPEDAIAGVALGLNKSMAKLTDQLYSLTQSRSQTLASLTPQHPKVREMDAQIAQIEQSIQAEMNRTLGSSAGRTGRARRTSAVALADNTRGLIVSQMATAQADAIGLNAQAQVLRQRLADLNQAIQQFPDLEEGLQNIEQEERSLSAALDNLRQKRFEAHLKEAETLSNVFVVDPPSRPTKAQFPNPAQLLLLGWLASGLAGVASAFLRRWVQRTATQRFTPVEVMVNGQAGVPPVGAPRPNPVGG